MTAKVSIQYVCSSADPVLGDSIPYLRYPYECDK